MGNTATKEARPSSFRHGHLRSSSNDPHQYTEASNPAGSSRQLRGSRPDLSFLGLGSHNNGGDTPTIEHRRETKQERDARKREKERAARLKERERSMKEEHVDGGYLVTQGVYVGVEDFSKAIVRQLMIERRLAPFWRGLNELSESWAEHQIVAAARGLPIPPADEVPPELECKVPATNGSRQPEKTLNNLTVPIKSRSQSFNSDSSTGTSRTPPRSQSPVFPGQSGSHLFRGRSKTLASLATSSKSNAPEMVPREFQLPVDPFVNSQRIEVYLYKNALECPICFLYYPPYLNKTRCCDQPICSECFVQIKRADPHPPEHEQPSQNTQPQPEPAEPNPDDCNLISQPAACPFCVQPEFGVSFEPPPFRRGLSYGPGHATHPLSIVSSPVSSSSSLGSGNANSRVSGSRRRTISLSADSPNVITTDKIRPDWAQKLATARSNATRRAAAATALHTAAYLMNGSGSHSDGRILGNSTRRTLLRRAAGNDSPTHRADPAHSNALAYLAERAAADSEHQPIATEGSANLTPPRGSSRRTRLEELEDMMMMEAIRLSLASEEERRKREEKEAKKAARKREKDSKKAEKLSERLFLPGNIAQDTATARSVGHDEAINDPEGIIAGEGKDKGKDKGKGVDRPDAASAELYAVPSHLSEVPLLLAVETDASASLSKLQLRDPSSASSSNSSFVESTIGDQIGTGSNCQNSTIDPVFSFHSLAAMVGEGDNISQERIETSTELPTADTKNSSSESRPPQTGRPTETPTAQGKEIQTQATEARPRSNAGTAT
ncbi:SNF1-interacting protein [Myotisia sp. PD_48]|nr:SNF1-interacting protein [Myotisia sp. PD_48]